MDLHGLDLNLLVVLDALFTERSVTRTGERIHLSQSATSAALGRLREFFKDDLLLPVGRKMLLTPHAEGLVDPVRDLLLRTEAIIKHNTIFHPETASRNFRIMMSDYAATVLMPEILPRLEQLAPCVTLEIVSHLDSPAEKLERGEIDLLIYPQGRNSPHHPCEDLFQEDFVCLVWSKNELVKETISLEQYLAMGHVGSTVGDQHMPTIDQTVFERFGYERRIEIHAMAFNLVPELVVGTKRIATVHRRLAQKHAAFLPIRLLEPPIAIPPFTETIQWHKYRDSDPAIAWLRKLIHEAANPTSAVSNPGPQTKPARVRKQSA
jgi:LysR family nod box-dependent transcriptional activator